MQLTVTIGEDQFAIILDTLTLEPGERHFIDLDSVSNKLGEQYLSVEVKQLDGAYLASFLFKQASFINKNHINSVAHLAVRLRIIELLLTDEQGLYI